MKLVRTSPAGSHAVRRALEDCGSFRCSPRGGPGRSTGAVGGRSLTMRATAVAFLVAAFGVCALRRGSAPTVLHGDSAEMQIVARAAAFPMRPATRGSCSRAARCRGSAAATPPRRVSLMDGVRRAVGGNGDGGLRTIGVSIGSALVAAGLYALSSRLARGAARRGLFVLGSARAGRPVAMPGRVSLEAVLATRWWPLLACSGWSPPAISRWILVGSWECCSRRGRSAPVRALPSG